MFVIPKAWATHSNLLQNILLHDIQSGLHKPAVFPNVGAVLESHYNMIQARIQVFTSLSSLGSDITGRKRQHGFNVDVRTRNGRKQWLFALTLIGSKLTLHFRIMLVDFG